MTQAFLLDKLAHYVWALSQPWPSNPNGYDVRYMTKEYKDAQQFSLEMLDELIEAEDRLDANHQQFFWLNIDAAADTVGMLEADGANISSSGTINSSSYNRVAEERKKFAYVALVKSNIERIKDHFRNVPLGWEAVANDPMSMAEALAGFNALNTEILNENRWQQQLDAMQHDFTAYGSGVFHVLHDPRMAIPDDTWFEEKIRQGVELDWNQYKLFHKITKSHIVEYVDTFEMLRSRSARGEYARDFSHSSHWKLSRIRPIRVSDARLRYPKAKDRILPNQCHLYDTINPNAAKYQQDEGITYLKETWITCPVEYTLDVKINLGGGIYHTEKKHRRRNAIVYIARLENAGVVDMNIDKYAHNSHEFTQFVHTPSKKHSCGIGYGKYGQSGERIKNIMLNGQLRFFDRMVKGGGFFLKGVMDQDIINQRTKENAWIEIDTDSLPPGLRGKPISDLIVDNRPQQMPIVYDQIMMRAEDATNRGMMIPDAARGVKQGNSGRQQALLTDQAERVMNTGVSALESGMPVMGKKLHSNIIQFHGNETDIFVETTDLYTNSKLQHVLNYVEAFREEYNVILDEWEQFPIAIKNNLMTLEYTTQLASRSIVPINPTERRFFYQELESRITPMIQTEEGTLALEFINKFGYGGVPGIEELVQRILAVKAERAKLQQQAMEMENTWRRTQAERDQANREVEAEQNMYRLSTKFLTDQEKLRGKRPVNN